MRIGALDEIVDLDRFPIHRLDSPVRAELVAETRSQLDAYGCFRISNFIRPEAIASMLAEATALRDQTFWAETSHNPYASKPDPDFPDDHPRNVFQDRSSGFINSDLLATDSPLNLVYDSHVMTHFVWECLGTDQPVYPWADPLGRNPYGRDGVRELDLLPGDLQLFKGRFSMHRVTQIVGPATRYIALPTYVHDPWRMNRPHHSINYYGRATDLHYARELSLADGLTD